MYTEYEDGDYEFSSNNYRKMQAVRRAPVRRPVRRPQQRAPRNSFIGNLFNGNKKIISIVIGIVVVLVLLIGTKEVTAYFNSYEYFEKQMVEKAKEYVSSHNMSFRNKVFIDLTQLGIQPKEECSLLSGVIVDSQGNYQPYLSCTEYATEIIKNDTSVVSLNGNTIMVLPKGIPYVEPGVKFGKYTVIGKVGTEEGVYDVTYNATLNGKSFTLKRLVIVTNNGMARGMYPTLTLTGNKVEYTLRGYDYVDKGATARDSVDGDLVDKISGSHNINPDVAGEYEYVYTVTNSRGYTNIVKRKVVVVENYTNTVVTATVGPETMTNGNVTITINVFGNNFKSIYLPTGQEVASNSVTYQAKQNGDYTFLALDKDGKSVTKIVKVSNIDKTPPKASCSAKVYTNYIDVQATQTNNKQISGFNYIIDGKQSGYIGSTTYRLNKVNGAKSVKVQVKDSIGNSSTSTCSVKIMDPTIGNNKVKYYTYNGVEYVVPNTKTDVATFERATCRKISQSVDPENCGSSCLSFSLYHSAYIQYGNPANMSEGPACNYGYGGLARVDTRSNPTKQAALKMVMEEILKGNAPVLQVTGTKTRSSRHFVMVVGYRRSKYNASDLVEEDLLVIDSWTGCYATISYADTSKRTMFDNKDGKGYRVDLMIGR